MRLYSAKKMITVSVEFIDTQLKCENRDAVTKFLPINFLLRGLDSSTDWKPTRE